jgi:hypothetical protein
VVNVNIEEVGAFGVFGGVIGAKVVGGGCMCLVMVLLVGHQVGIDAVGGI